MALRKMKTLKFKIVILLLITLVLMVYLKYIHDYEPFESISSLQKLQIIEGFDIDCNQWNDIKNIITISDVTNATMVDTINYLNKLYCHRINQHPEQYIDDYTKQKTFDIAHVFNIYKTDIHDYSYLLIAAPVTFVSMLRAKEQALKYNISVGIYSANYVQDNAVVPIFINKLPALQRSLKDSIWAQNLSVKPKKLPFISDIMDSLYDNVNSKYIIYTNADIGLQPNFYVDVMKLLKNNSFENGVSITRKTIDYISDRNGELLTFLNLNDIYKMGLHGTAHGGHDCFVMKREIWKLIRMENIFLGYPTIGKTLMKQLMRFPRTDILRSEYLTFHIGATRRMSKWFTKNGWKTENQSVKYDNVHHQHSQLNRMFCDIILKRYHLK